MQTQVAKVIDAQVESLRQDEIAGAWRALCGLMLVITASSMRRRARHRKDDVLSQRTARQWLDGGGVVSFAECCECLDIDSDRARDALHSIAAARAGKPKSRVVFGVECNDA